MNTLNIDLTSSQSPAGPFCQACGGRTRLAGVEQHPRLPRTDLRTYQCAACRDVQAVVAPHPSPSINAIIVVASPF
jgi:hypothetical protein